MPIFSRLGNALSLAGYLHKARVPGFHTGICQHCEQGEETPQHVLIHCPRFQGEPRATPLNRELDFRWLLTNPIGVKRATRWWLRRNIVNQFRLVNQLIKDG